MQLVAACAGPFDPRESKPGPPTQQALNQQENGYEAWTDMKRNVDMVEELTAEIAEAHATHQWAVVGTLVKQQQRWLDNLKRPRGILDQVHPAEPNSPQQPEGS